LQNKSKELCEAYARANPLPLARAKVPVLEVIGDHTNFALCESLVVADYIAERYPNVGLIPTNSVLRSQGDDEKFDLAVEEFHQGLINVNAFLEKMGDSSRGPFLFGDQFSLAECNTAPFLQRACNVLPVFTGGTNSVFVDPIKFCDEQDLSRLKTWIMAVLARPSVKATELPKEEMIQSVTKMLNRFAEMEKK
jgi:glutathione S-transferase